MSSIYTGTPALARLSGKAAIVGASNATPISITTAAAHGFQSGDYVSVLGVLGNTAANSAQNTPWQIGVLSTNTFLLLNSFGNGAYTSGGTAYDVSFSPAFTIPGDGDAFNAASFNVAIQALGDRTAQLAQVVTPRISVFGTTTGGQLIAQYSGGSSDDTWATWSTGTPGSAGWQTAASGDQIALSSFNIRCNTGDLFDCRFSLGEVSAATNPLPLAIGAQFSGSGAGFTQSFSAKRVGVGLTMPVELSGNFSVQSGGGGLAASVGTFSSGSLTITGLSGMTAGMVGASLTLRGCAAPGNNGTFPITFYNSPSSVTVYNSGGTASDTNSGAILAFVDNQTMQFVLQVFGTVGAQPTYTMRGHRLFIVNHYRPNALFF